LRLRAWRLGDRAPFAELNGDPEVMATLGPPLSREASDALAERICDAMAKQGWGLWAVEVDGGASFIGFIGLSRVGFDAPFAPAIEIGWRLARAHQGRGYATEGARAVLAWAARHLDADELVSFTAAVNARSERVMQRIGMQRDPAGDFDHPGVPVDSPLRPHILYRFPLRGPAAARHRD